MIAGTAFAFVHFLDDSDATGWELPSGSRLMETGGFKGRSREVPRDVLHESLARRFAIPDTNLVNQYGMTELGSQFYDSTLVYPDEPRRKLIPPWTRVRLVDPATADDVAPGEIGILLIQDLANTGSIAVNGAQSAAVDMLADGSASAAFLGGAVPTASITQASASNEIFFVPFGAAERARLADEFLFFNPARSS